MICRATGEAAVDMRCSFTPLISSCSCLCWSVLPVLLLQSCTALTARWPPFPPALTLKCTCIVVGHIPKDVAQCLHQLEERCNFSSFYLLLRLILPSSVYMAARFFLTKPHPVFMYLSLFETGTIHTKTMNPNIKERYTGKWRAIWLEKRESSLHPRSLKKLTHPHSLNLLTPPHAEGGEKALQQFTPLYPSPVLPSPLSSTSLFLSFASSPLPRCDPPPLFVFSSCPNLISSPSLSPDLAPLLPSSSSLPLLFISSLHFSRCSAFFGAVD